MDDLSVRGPAGGTPGLHHDLGETGDPDEDGQDEKE
jgi:hypothetical protein